MSGSEVVVLRCEDCGDTFTAHADELVLCPSCASDRARIATEPFL